MKRPINLAVMLITLLSGCKVTTPREEVFVLDVSQSIDANAERQMFSVTREAAQHMRRGDSLTIIPITGNAEAELQGRTLHYVIPTESDRKAYDADIHSLQTQIKDDLTRIQADALAHPGKHSDIIGSVGVALEEFSNKQTDKQLFVLSDFVQEDNRFNFRTDSRLSDQAKASELGKAVRLAFGNDHRPKVVLGRLNSRQYSTLTPERQCAINAFWGRVLAPAAVSPDGTASVLRSLCTR